jgi:Mce-associated membrane protein
VTAVVDATETETTTQVAEVARPEPLASWPARAGAFAVDVLLGLGVVATVALTGWALPQDAVWWWVSISVGALVILAMLVNRWVLPSITGWTVGRALFGIAVVRSDGGSVGPWRLLLRDLAHLLDTASLFVGWLWPLWDARGRTFADLLLRTEVRRADLPRPPRNPRLLTAILALAAALICLGGAAVSYLVVYQRDRAVDWTREQLAIQGPKIVEEMLSYDPESLQDDFAHAQSLATDGYRPQLVTQQQAVQKAGPVTNEYWVTNGSVLTASPDRGSMLLLMQGQRGTPPNQRFITATVRVGFEKSTDGRWRVADLTVVTKPPQATQGGK